MEVKRIVSFDALRAIAFMEVCISHMIRTKYNLGGVGVSLFIFLSGFCMYYAYEAKEISCNLKSCVLFSWHKIKKLYALHILIILLLLIRETIHCMKVGVYDSLLNSDTLVTVLAHICLVQSYIPYEKIYLALNSVSWYLSCCAFFYFVFPYIKLFINKRIQKINVAIQSIIGVFLIQILLRHIVDYIQINNKNDFLYRFPLYRIFEFIIGCLCGFVFTQMSNEERVEKKRPRNIVNAKICFVIISATQILLIVFDVLVTSKLRDAKYSGYIITFFSILIIFFWSWGCLADMMGRWSWVSILSDLSGYGFLLHGPVMLVVNGFCIKIFGEYKKWSLFSNAVAFLGMLLLSYGYKRLMRSICERK